MTKPRPFDALRETETIRVTGMRIRNSDGYLSYHDCVMLVEAELLATENIQSAIRFLFTTPDHPEPQPFRIQEVYTGLEGQARIKLVGGVGRVFHYDRHLISCRGLHRAEASPIELRLYL